MGSPVFRRSFLQGFIVTVAASHLAGCGDDTAPPVEGPSHDPEDQDRVFPQGIASGDPGPSSVILWVRVEPEDDADPIEVKYEIASDENFSNIVAFGSQEVEAETDHTLRLRVTDLNAYTTYFYRFTARDVRSITGRTKTAPTDSDNVSPRFAFASCQDFIGRYYHSWKALLAEPEVDFVLFLGDYVYETNGDPDFQTTDPERAISIADGIAIDESNPDVKAASSLEDYRGLYKQYRRDPDLRAVHALYPFICIWDDHEFANDCWQDHSTDFNDAKGDEKSTDRRHAASRAWFEYQPADVSFDDSKSPPADLSIRRQIRYGKHVELFLTDQRSFRSDHVIPEGAAPEDRPPGAPDTVPQYSAAGKNALFENSEVFSRSFVIKEGFDPIEEFVKPTMLGDEQKSWLISSVRSSTATWKFWGNEVQLAQMLLDLTAFDIPALFQAIYYFTVDQWDGYRTERREILEALANVDNVVALTGDIHAFYASEIHIDPDDISNAPTMVEYVTAGISSSPVQEIAQKVVDSNVAFTTLQDLVPHFDEILMGASPEYKFAKSQSHGVAIVEVNEDTNIKVTFIQIDDVKTKKWNGETTRVTFTTPNKSNRVVPM